MTVKASGSANVDHQFELNQIESVISEVADFFHDYPGSLPEQEEDIENKARHAAGRLNEFIAERWGS
jgi:hypothetical protein